MRIFQSLIPIRFIVLLLLFITACQAKPDGAIEGSVVPMITQARVTALQAGKIVSFVDSDTRNGKFRQSLAPGIYDLSVSSSGSPFPLSFPGIIIEPGKTTTLPPIEITQSSGTATVSGIIAPGSSGARVTLLFEGKERTSINTAPDGKYGFIGLPAGQYSLQVNSSGFASDSVTFNIGEDQKAAQNIRLLPVSHIEGVDWNSGKIRAWGKGLPPINKSNPTVDREMAKRAAITIAQKNLLTILEQLELGPGQKVTSLLGERKYEETISGFIRGYSLVVEQDLGGGALEVELELPLTGPTGFTRLLTE